MIIGLLWVPDVRFNALTNEEGKSEGIAILMQRRVLHGKVRTDKTYPSGFCGGSTLMSSLL
jgi:ribosomal protein S4E